MVKGLKAKVGKRLAGFLICLALALLGAGCSDENTPPPTTMPTSIPTETSGPLPSTGEAGSGEQPLATQTPAVENPGTQPVISDVPTVTQAPPATQMPTVTQAPPAPTTILPVPPTWSIIPVTPTPSATSPVQNPATDSDKLKKEVRPLLDQLWQVYKSRYVQQDGRVKDPQRTDASTSEGESYALLRSYWQNDRATFDAILNWSLNNLQLARGDKLFAYLWGKTPDNQWKILDRAVATDADQDIAFALLMAGNKWNEPRYLTLGREIINDIWNKTIVIVNGRPYLTAGDWAPALKRPVLNPSYYSPYEYRLFAQADPDKSHNWMAVVDTAYEVIKGCTENKLDATAGKLPPNWCAIDKETGALTSALDTDKVFDTDYGYDAFRTVWRLALDYRWNGEKRALNYLQTLTPLLEDWKNRGKLAVIYSHDGQPKDNTEDLGIYAGSGLPLFLTVEPDLADHVVAWKLLPGLKGLGQDDPDPAHEDASKARTYYAQNWTWFGLALYCDILPNPVQ